MNIALRMVFPNPILILVGDVAGMCACGAAVVGGGVPGSQRAVLPVGGDFGVVPGYDSETATGRAAVSALRSMGVTVYVR